MKVERIAWADLRPKLRRAITPGEHAVVIGSTGSGKSVLAREVVPMFGRNIVVLDGKGGRDPSLVFPGFTKIKDWPPPAERHLMRAIAPRGREPIRVVLAPAMRKITDLPGARDAFARALSDLFTRHGRDKVYAVYIDEMQIVADPQEGMGLKRFIGPLLRTKRFDGMSIITATQFPTWIGPSAYRESTHRFLFRIHDEDSNKKLGQITGQRAAVLPVLDSLGRHMFAWHNIKDPDRLYVSKVVIPKV